MTIKVLLALAAALLLTMAGCKSSTSPSTGPAIPTGLDASQASPHEIDVSWIDRSNDETGFELQHRIAPIGGYSTIAVLPANTQAYVDVSLKSATDYGYRVRAISNSGSSPFTAEVQEQTLALPSGTPSAPVNLTASDVTATGLRLSWTDTATDEKGYRVERIDISGMHTVLGDLPENSSEFQVTGLAPNTTYSYLVVAYNSVEASDPSNTVSVSTSAS